VNGFLLDTNIPSETLRRVPEPRVIRWLQTQSKRDVQFVSVVALGELRRGTALLAKGTRRSQLEQFLETTVPLWFGPRILPVTQSIADTWGVLDAQRQLAGKPLNIANGLIAATALQHELTLVTRNSRDFAGLGVAILNPWDWN
jgi:tRNA(fMet)-specific endonuclease VapC